MKYKLIGIFGIFVILLAAAAAPVLEADVKESPRIHQHLTARRDTGCDCGGTELCSHLPLVIIDTGGQEIPGAVTERKDRFNQTVYTTAEDGGPTIYVEVRVIDNQDCNNHPSDQPAFTTRSEFRIRGASSRYYEKLGYLMKFTDESGNNRDLPVMGMGAHHDWALHGPILDKSLVRNYMWYNISGEIMEYAPNCRFCELIVNGEYLGLYLVLETITDGDNCRLNLKINVKNTEATGYLLRSDRPTETELETLRDVYTYSERINQVPHDFSIRYPGTSKLTDEFKKKIELDYSAFEKSLYSYDYNTGEYGYWNWIDVDSFAYYFLINEFTKNLDAGSYSTYIYKEMNEPYRMCVWDFNNSCGNYSTTQAEPRGFFLVKTGWYLMLMKDEAFVQRLLELYEQLRQTYFSEEYLMNYIDDTISWLGPAVERNSQRWSEQITNWDGLGSNLENPHSQEEAVQMLKNWLIRRGEWLDEYIDVLQQYAHPSRNKKFNH